MQDKQQVIDMLMYLKWSWHVEISKDANYVSTFNESYWKEQIYFVAGMDNKPTKRSGNADFTKKRYVFIDIDIRNEYLQNNWVVLSDEELDVEIGKIKDCLDKNSIDYQILVHSWNWVHMYLCWEEEEFTPKEYSDGVCKLIETIDYVLSPIWYSVDDACKNISRLSRLPWSINTRKKSVRDYSYDMWNFEVKILHIDLASISIYFSLLKSMWKSYAEEQDKIRQARTQYISQNTSSDDMWWEINKAPIWDIVGMIWWLEVIDRWLDNTAIWEWHKNMWAYRYKPYNLLVNTWSSRITSGKNYYTPYELVLNEYCGWDVKRTMEFFHEKFGIDTDRRPNTMSLVPSTNPVEERWLKAYMYPHPFEDFVCILSWEFALVSASTNSWKSSFLHAMMQKQIDDWKQCFYVNLEFTIDDIARTKWLNINWKKKSDLSIDHSTLTESERASLDNFVRTYTSRFDYIDKPDGIWYKDFMQLIIQKAESAYEFIVVDTLDKITNDAWVWFAEFDMLLAKSLQKICQDYNIVIVWIKHTNKKWEIWWTYNIQTQAKHTVFIERDYEWWATTFKLLKDKNTSNIEIDVNWVRWEYVKAS